MCIAGGDTRTVGSLFAFARDDPSESLSMGNTRILLGTLVLGRGARLFSNRRRALLVWVQDAGAAHDLLLPVGDAPALAGACKALTAVGVQACRLPDPLNLFLGTRVGEDGRIALLPSTRLASHVILRATMALYAAVVAWSGPGAAGGAGALSISVRNRLVAPGSPLSDGDG